jgi:hypothetical protein
LTKWLRSAEMELTMRVYVLGAGASKCAKYPLASELGKGLAAYIFSLVPDFSEGYNASVALTASDPDEETRQRFLDALEDYIANPLDSDFSRIGDSDSLTSAGGAPDEDNDSIQAFREDKYRFLLSQITQIYGGMNDFEEVLTDLMTCGPRSHAAALQPGIRESLIAGLQDAVGELFDTIRSAPAPCYDQLALRLRRGDLIVTFNYDLGIERALSAAGLWDVGDGYGFQIGQVQQSSAIEVLKLHGSTNWRAVMLGGRMDGYFAQNEGYFDARPVLFFRSDQIYLGFPDFVDPFCSNLEAAVTLPAMVMPALPKRFHFPTTHGLEWKTFWDRLWQRAEDAITKADEVVIIGYSLPCADGRARDLLLGASNKTAQLTICCGETTRHLEQQFRENGFTTIRQIPDPTFCGFLAEQFPRLSTWAGD